MDIWLISTKDRIVWMMYLYTELLVRQELYYAIRMVDMVGNRIRKMIRRAIIRYNG